MKEISLDIAFHPGEELEEKLQEMQLTYDEFARKSGLEETFVKNVIDKKIAVTPKVAVIFEMMTQIPASLWLKMQHDYDDYILSQKRKSWIENFQQFVKHSAAIF